MIELGKFCLSKQNLNHVFHISVTPLLSLTQCDDSEPKFEISSAKYAMKKMHAQYFGLCRNTEA